VVMQAFSGQCHCGAIRMELQFTRLAEETQVRSCQCGFCTRHGALTISDPAGTAVVHAERSALAIYKFATMSGTSLVCGRCGVYAGALIEDGGRTWSIANARGLAVPEFASRIGVPQHYDHETAQDRMNRRKAKWTPTEFRLSS
jgi:hypothetical protein